MPRNLSVDQFKQLMASIPKQIIGDLDAAVFDNAERLKRAQQSAARTGESGNLVASHRVEPGRAPLRAVVRAGGPLTTRPVRNGASATYDYALANEFGTEDQAARPWFYPTYRLLKKQLRTAIAKRAKEAIGKVVPLK